jgi:hypothetical protein
LDVRESAPSNGLIFELGRFQKKHGLSNEVFLNWFCSLTQGTAHLPTGTAKKVRTWVNDLT